MLNDRNPTAEGAVGDVVERWTPVGVGDRNSDERPAGIRPPAGEHLGDRAVFLVEHMHHEPIGALDDVVDVRSRAEQEVDASRVALRKHQGRDGEPGPAGVIPRRDDGDGCSKAAAQAAHRVSFLVGRNKGMLPLVYLPGHSSSTTFGLTVPAPPRSSVALPYPSARRTAAIAAATTSTHLIHDAPLRTASLEPAQAPDIWPAASTAATARSTCEALANRRMATGE